MGHAVDRAIKKIADKVGPGKPKSGKSAEKKAKPGKAGKRDAKGDAMTL